MSTRCKSTISKTFPGTLGVTKDAVNNWQYGRNGLSNPENIKKAADFLHVDWLLLVKKVDGEITMFKLTERQKDAAKRIYDILIWFLEEFSNTNGFSSWWQEFKEQGVYDREEAIFERITRMEEKVRLTSPLSIGKFSVFNVYVPG